MNWNGSVLTACEQLVVIVFILYSFVSWSAFLNSRI